MKIIILSFAAHICISACVVITCGVLGIVPDGASVGWTATFILWLALLLPYNREGQQ